MFTSINKPEVTKLSTYEDNSAEVNAGGDISPNAVFELDVVISNVVCAFNVGCRLNLRDIAQNGLNVEFRRENGLLTMRLRRPYTTASMWPSGHVICCGAISEPQAKVAARRYARSLSKLGYPVRFHRFRIVNVLGTCSMPWPIRIRNFSERHRKNASYEPELHPAVIYKMSDPRATINIFSTGSVTLTAGSVDAIKTSIQRVYPLVYEFRMRSKIEIVDDLSKIDKANNGTQLQCETITPENICGNARRRAAECWATNVQMKRPRFNDAGSLASPLNASPLAHNFCPDSDKDEDD